VGHIAVGPMVIADAATGTIATNQPAPEGARPRSLGFANAITQWDGQTWSTFVWQLLASFDEPSRGVLMMHELFHRVERPLGLMTEDGQNGHLDTLEGRYWQLLEWRALARALGSSGAERTAAVKDALAFRFARRQLFPAAAANEVLEEIREGLAHYTATVITASSPLKCAVSIIFPPEFTTYARSSPEFSAPACLDSFITTAFFVSFFILMFF